MQNATDRLDFETEKIKEKRSREEVRINRFLDDSRRVIGLDMGALAKQIENRNVDNLRLQEERLREQEQLKQDAEFMDALNDASKVRIAREKKEYAEYLDHQIQLKRHSHCSAEDANFGTNPIGLVDTPDDCEKRRLQQKEVAEWNRSIGKRVLNEEVVPKPLCEDDVREQILARKNLQKSYNEINKQIALDRQKAARVQEDGKYLTLPASSVYSKRTDFKGSDGNLVRQTLLSNQSTILSRELEAARLREVGVQESISLEAAKIAALEAERERLHLHRVQKTQDLLVSREMAELHRKNRELQEAQDTELDKQYTELFFDKRFGRSLY